MCRFDGTDIVEWQQLVLERDDVDEVAPLFRGLSSRGTVVGVDVVEYCPGLDLNWTTADTVLRLLINLLSVSSAEVGGR